MSGLLLGVLLGPLSLREVSDATGYNALRQGLDHMLGIHDHSRNRPGTRAHQCKRPILKTCLQSKWCAAVVLICALPFTRPFPRFLSQMVVNPFPN